MLEFLPYYIKESLRCVNMEKVYEIRLRADKPCTVNYEGVYKYLGNYGICKNKEQAIFCTHDEIAECIYRAGKCSVYSVEEQIKKGFLTTEHGERIGIAGEYVFEQEKPLTIRNFSSLCIRVPHEVVGSGQAIYEKYMLGKEISLLLMSPPGIGKTTAETLPMFKNIAVAYYLEFTKTPNIIKNKS